MKYVFPYIAYMATWFVTGYLIDHTHISVWWLLLPALITVNSVNINKGDKNASE